MKANKFYEELIMTNFFLFRTNDFEYLEDFENIPN